MKHRFPFLLLAALLAAGGFGAFAVPGASAQVGRSVSETTSPESLLSGSDDLIGRASEGPIDISSTGETTYNSTPQGRIATATGSVAILTYDANIYADYAEYNLDTHQALLVGNVRIFRSDTVVLSDRAIYNFDTKAIRAVDLFGSRPPFEFGGLSAFSPGAGLQYNLRQSFFTTDDSSKPDYHLSSHRVRIYPDNHVVYIGSTLYIGQTPVFYFPYFYQSLDQQSGYTLTPGYSSEWGAYLLTGITFPVTEKITALLRADFRSTRGVAGGFNLEYRPNRKPKVPPTATTALEPYASDDNPSAPVIVEPFTPAPYSLTHPPIQENQNSDPGFALTGEALSREIRSKEGAQFLSYATLDQEPDLNRTALDRLPVSDFRYRLELKDTTFFTDDLIFKADIDKLSDRYLLQDFFEGAFTRDPQPDNNVSLLYYQPTFVTTLLARAQLNSFFNSTERLPELSIEIVRQPILGSRFFYEGEDSAGYLKRTFDEEVPLPDYGAYRMDTFHQITYPGTYFGWLSVVPRVGVRATFYSESAPANTAAFNLQSTTDDTQLEELEQLDAATANQSMLLRAAALKQAIEAFKPEGSILRPVVNTGIEASFKLSRVYDDVETRFLGLDEIQHVIQPYVNVAYVDDFGVGSRKLLQFDRLVPSTQLAPIDFPQYTTIDSIDTEAVARLGIRNRIQTKRDALTFNWLEVDTFFQVNIDNPQDPGRFSNLFNQITLRPLPWINLSVDSQVPAFDRTTGFTEIDTALGIQATSDLDLTISHRYLNDNPYFMNSSLVSIGAYYRFDDNWAASFAERYEFAQHDLQAQSYTVYRDLSSFVASFGLNVRNNAGVKDYGIQLSFTLKGLPRVSLPVGFDLQSSQDSLAQ